MSGPAFCKPRFMSTRMNLEIPPCTRLQLFKEIALGFDWRRARTRFGLLESPGEAPDLFVYWNVFVRHCKWDTKLKNTNVILCSDGSFGCIVAPFQNQRSLNHPNHSLSQKNGTEMAMTPVVAKADILFYPDAPRDPYS